MFKNSDILFFGEKYVKDYYKNVDYLMFLSLFNILIITLVLLLIIPRLISTLHEEWGLAGLNRIVILCVWILTLLGGRAICLATKKIIGAIFAHILMLATIALSIVLIYFVSQIDSLVEERLYSDALPYMYLSIINWSVWLHGGTDIALIGLSLFRQEKSSEKRLSGKYKS